MQWRDKKDTIKPEEAEIEQNKEKTKTDPQASEGDRLETQRAVQEWKREKKAKQLEEEGRRQQEAEDDRKKRELKLVREIFSVTHHSRLITGENRNSYFSKTRRNFNKRR